MKPTLPKEITDLADMIAAKRRARDDIHADIDRAMQAAGAAEQVAAGLAEVRRQRDERRAAAFIAKQPADLAELDEKIARLEREHAATIDEGHVATLALRTLHPALADIELAITTMNDRRGALAMSWLADRRERALDRYIKALVDLGPIVAEAAGADRALAALGDIEHGKHSGAYLLRHARLCDFGLPYSRRVQRPGMPPDIRMLDIPVAWLRDDTHGDQEHAQMLAALLAAGVNR